MPNRALELIGGHPSLDFANTVGWHAGADPIEELPGYDDLIDWAVAAGVITAGEQRRLLRRARSTPGSAKKALLRAITIREFIYRIFAAVAHGESPPQEALDQLHTLRVEALSHATAAWSGRLTLSFSGSDSLLAPVWPLVVAAVDLLQSPDLARVRQCGNDPCGWLFVDRSKNRSRRWCSSGDCGNEVRVRRFRKRAGGTG